MNKKEMTQSAKLTVESRRLKALDKCEKNLAKLRSFPDWKRCENALKSAQVKAVLYGDEGAKKRAEKLAEERAKLLEKYGFSEKDLLPDFTCKKCEDTGFVNGKECSCLKAEIRKLLVRESNVQSAAFTFENSTETNKHNLAVAKKAREVCLTNSLRNILLIGGTGSGKTYLLTACANLCMQKEKNVLFATAYRLSELFLEAHLSDLATKQTIMDNLVDVDVLIVDDLGTENVYKGVTAEYLFALVNERISMQKQTFFSTNLSLADIRERYDERIFSRLVDQSITFVAKLDGDDKRLKK